VEVVEQPGPDDLMANGKRSIGRLRDAHCSSIEMHELRNQICVNLTIIELNHYYYFIIKQENNDWRIVKD